MSRGGRFGHGTLAQHVQRVAEADPFLVHEKGEHVAPLAAAEAIEPLVLGGIP